MQLSRFRPQSVTNQNSLLLIRSCHTSCQGITMGQAGRRS